MSSSLNDSITDEFNLVNEENVTILGRYQFLRTIGKGTYGKVKLSRDLQTGDKVAVKILEKVNIKTEKHIMRIKREIRFLKLLHHPNIVKVFDVIETTDSIFIIMEYIIGGELFDYIAVNKRLKEKEARYFFRQIISALEYCHQNAVIHRDLKPENLLLDANKNIKIIDFGFANTYKTDSLMDTYCGSPFYASPEMILGKKYEGPEVDVWSLGVILFALLCGYLPFDDDNVKELYRKIINANFSIPEHVPEGCKFLISRMIVADVTKRANLDEIKNHTWVSIGYDGPPESHIPKRFPISLVDIEDFHMKKLIGYGYKRDDIEKAFDETQSATTKKVISPIVSTCYLLKEKMARDGDNGISISSGKIDVKNVQHDFQIISICDSTKSSTPPISEIDAESYHPSSSPEPSSPNAQLESLPIQCVKTDPLSTQSVYTSIEGKVMSSPSDASHVLSRQKSFDNTSLRTGKMLRMLTQQRATPSRAVTAYESGDISRSVFSSARTSVVKSKSSIVEGQKSLFTFKIQPTESWRTGPIVSRKSQLRTISRWFMSVSHMSSKSPKDILESVIASLQVFSDAGVKYEREPNSPFIIVVEVDVETFDSKIANVPEERVFSDESNDDENSIREDVSMSDLGSISSAKSTSSFEKAFFAFGAFKKLAVLPEDSIRDGVVTFQIEVCKLAKENLHGLHFKRLAGKVLSYTAICRKILPQIKIE